LEVPLEERSGVPQEALGLGGGRGGGCVVCHASQFNTARY
jgi:hypothetical protein